MKGWTFVAAPRGLRGAVVCGVVTTLLTAGSQAPGPDETAPVVRDDGPAVPGGFVSPDAALPEVPSQGDDSYYVDLPPLKTVRDVEGVFGARAAASSTAFTPERAAFEAGLPAGVLTAYRRAAASVGRTDPGCGLRWELLAAIGKVESGHARGGAVAANGDTLTRITGPALDGNGFALIHDSEGGVWDGDAVYDRAVGPMQFLPTTWKTWGADGNGDGTTNPNNVHDAALAAAHYLCAGGRDLRTGAGLDRAILSYNHSREYLNLVRGWMEFYLRGVHTVSDGGGTVPTGADSAARRAGGRTEGDSRAVVPAASPTATAPGTSASAPSPTRSPGASSRPRPTRSPGPVVTGPVVTEPVETEPVETGPGGTPGPTGSATPTGGPSPSPSGSVEPTPTGSVPVDGAATGAPEATGLPPVPSPA
ncbi:lytic murein transglycosylase [Streptomyces sp. NPDC003781]|uniref:lytic transglycosylase domain-containing protein n=1 Tax=Streptomyces sp. NPDC003781 TaxID=3364686 RepID=UPI0036B67F35